MNEHTRSFRDLSAEGFDTRTLLKNAAEQAIERRYEDLFIADVDSHHYETEAFKEIAEFIEDPVLRAEAKFQGTSRGGICGSLPAMASTAPCGSAAAAAYASLVASTMACTSSGSSAIVLVFAISPLL